MASSPAGYRLSADSYQPMSTAPRDGTLVRFWLRDGKDFTGYYSGKWWGWVDHDDPLPLIRGDNQFLGLEAVDQGEPPIRREMGQPSAPIVVEPVPSAVVESVPTSIAAPAVESFATRIVTARKPGRRR